MIRIISAPVVVTLVALGLLSCSDKPIEAASQNTPQGFEGDGTYQDDFEEYEVGARITGSGANGFEWTDVHDAVYVTDEISHSGGHSLKAEYGPVNPTTGSADHWWAEQNFDMGRDLEEVWVEFYIYHLDGTEGLGAAFERTETAPTKMFSIWSPAGDGYNDAFHTYEYWSIDGDPARVRVNTNTGRHGGNIVLPSSDLRGTWIQFRTHFRMSTSDGAADGLSETWINGVLQESVTGIDWNPSGSSNRSFRFGYLFGYDNEHFPAATAIYIDDIRFYGQDPGW